MPRMLIGMLGGSRRERCSRCEVGYGGERSGFEKEDVNSGAFVEGLVLDCGE